MPELGLEVRPGFTLVSASSSTAKSLGSRCIPVRGSPLRLSPGEVLVSRTVKDLVAGSGLEFEERGEQSSRESRVSGVSTP